MFDDLAVKNWAFSLSIFTESFCHDLAQECQKLHSQGQLTQASVGRGALKATHVEVRGDFTLWLNEEQASPRQLQMLQHLEMVREQLNRAFYLGIKRFEAHFALYPPGAGYDKHIDNFRGSGSRKITFILYLNGRWQKGHGGELSIFAPDQTNQLITQIEPILGTFVLFRSDLFPHQVEKSFQPRLSITGWFRDDAL